MNGKDWYPGTGGAPGYFATKALPGATGKDLSDEVGTHVPHDIRPDISQSFNGHRNLLRQSN